MDLNCLYHYMRAYQRIFIFIRAKPKEMNYIEMLKTFEKYIDLGLNAKKIDLLKIDIGNAQDTDFIEKESLKEELEINVVCENFKDIEKLKKYFYVLRDISYDMIKILESKDYERVKDFADAVHNFPEYLITDNWTTAKYFDTYIKPYNKKWNDNFLNEMEYKNKPLLLFNRILNRK